jgi:hypothetical protein
MANNELKRNELHPKASGAALGGSFAILITWVAGLFGVEIPNEVAVAAGTLLAFLGSYLAKSPS